MFLAFLLSDAATNLDIHSVHLTYFKIWYIMIIDDEQMRKTQQHSHTHSLPRDTYFCSRFVSAAERLHFLEHEVDDGSDSPWG